ncbi:DUF3721 domain-containing protein [bacterium]|nr:DUF3721 domain-containing protein [bacterium]
MLHQPKLRTLINGLILKSNQLAIALGTMTIAKQRRFSRLINPYTAIMVALMVAPVMPSPAQAHRKGIYASEAEALTQAEKIGCTDVHQNNGRWMACADERDLHQQMRRQ